MLLPEQRIIPALDFETNLDVEQCLAELPNVRTVKIDCLWRQTVTDNHHIDFFVDEKYFDIPQTVSRKVTRLTNFPNVKMCTVHAEKSVMAAAVKAAKDTELKILSVILLTSMAGRELHEFYNYPYEADAKGFVLERLQWSLAAGCHGTICSAQEVAAIRERVPDDFLIIVPGTRSDFAALHDHKRSGSSVKAIADGASHLVVGREIIDAENPAEAFDKKVQEIT